ncbi:MAG TPA: amidohydrolase family protein [Pyrinomonadaceae bacterium]|jgi:5-methylthioadenosine/S-adenosylhomocysteine deaminase
MTTLYCARWVLPMASPAIEDGAVAVEGERLADVGPRAHLLETFPQAEVRDFGEAAILPGLINCHSHLELTAMRGFLEREEGDFKSWLLKLKVAREERLTPDDLYVSAMSGAVEALRAGVTCMGDASSAANECMRALGESGLRGIVYQESFGPDPREAQAKFDELRERVSQLREDESERVRVGVSPHAPYSVSAPQLELIADFALAENLPLMMHAAESEAESQLMLKGEGPFAESLARRGIKWHTPRVSTVEYLKQVGLLRARPLLAHCIRVDQSDLETLKEFDARIAHCPKSNAKLGHGHAPFAGFIRHGLKVGLGSDSVASNNLCDLLEEARFAALLSRAFESETGPVEMLGAGDVLSAATLGGARALGLENRTGALAAGLQADLAVIALKHAHQLPVHAVQAALVFASSGRDVVSTVVAGKEVYREGRVVGVDEERLRERVGEIRDNLRF